MRRHFSVSFATHVRALVCAALAGLLAASPAAASTEHQERFENAAALLVSFTQDDATSIPSELLQRAHGIAVIPTMLRGGFLIGGRRGRGVISVRLADGSWSNPALMTLTGGSIGGQIGVESVDLVLVFANARSVRNIAEGKFTLGGDIATVAGPVGRHSAVALTGRAEVYAYVRSRGLYAGASFEGTRLDVDEQGTERFYSANPRAKPFEAVNAGTPPVARAFVATLQNVSYSPAPAAPPRGGPGGGGSSPEPDESEGVRTYPLGR